MRSTVVVVFRGALRHADPRCVMDAGSVRESVTAPRLPLTSRCWALLVLAGLPGCSASAVFECDQPSQCSVNGEAGTCEPDGYCSFPDASCPSGQRYGAYAGAGRAGMCVPTDPSTTSAATTEGEAGPMEGSGSSGSTGPVGTSNPVTLDGTSSTSAATLDGSETTDGTSTDGTSADGTSTGGTSSGGPETLLIYPAALAECNDPVDLDPDVCELGGNPPMGTLVVDLDTAGVGPIHGYLRFDLDDAVVPDTVVSVTLRLVASDVSMSPSSGEVYRVEPFGLMDLYAVQPSPIGAVLAPDQGAVAPNDVVEWSLPPDVLSLGEPSLHLGILPLSTDGIDYWNLDGLVPPELVIEQQP